MPAIPIPPALTVGGLIALLDAASALVRASADGLAALTGQTPEQVRALPLPEAVGTFSDVLKLARSATPTAPSDPTPPI